MKNNNGFRKYVPSVLLFLLFETVAVEKLKEDTVYKMIKRSEGYQEESVARALTEQRYGELDLTK